MTTARGFVNGDGVRLAYACWPGEGVPIVALHGLSANAMFYAGVAERLAGRRPLLSLDLRGRGDADKPETGYGMAQHARDVAGVMREWGIPKAVVVGHSMGSYVALALAEQSPELCAGVVLYDGGRLPVDEIASDPGIMQRFLEDARPIEMRMSTTFSSLDEYREYWRQLAVFRSDQWGPWVEAYLEYDLGGPPGELRPKCASTALAADVQDLLTTAVARQTSHIDVPVLALCADNGLVTGSPALITDGGIEDLARRSKSFEWQRLADTNHYTVALADPAATVVANRIVDFAISCGV
jgi:pimeloyl-ACP methyl ester carboxylesterase